MRLGFEARRYCRQAGGCSCRGIKERTGDIRVDPPPSPPSRQRRADCSPVIPSPGRRRSAGSRTPATTRCAACSSPRPGSAPWRSRSAASRTGTDAPPSPAPTPCASRPPLIGQPEAEVRRAGKRTVEHRDAVADLALEPARRLEGRGAVLVGREAAIGRGHVRLPNRTAARQGTLSAPGPSRAA